jgi:hypothetical protein
VHALALLLVQLRLDVDPLATEEGVAVIVTDGAGEAVTVTVANPVTLPPVPEQVSSYVPVVDSGPVLCDPLVAFVPLHALAATQLVAFVDVHDSVADAPLATVVGFAVNCTVGIGATVTAALCV